MKTIALLFISLVTVAAAQDVASRLNTLEAGGGNLNADNITSGTVPIARLASTNLIGATNQVLVIKSGTMFWTNTVPDLTGGSWTNGALVNATVTTNTTRPNIAASFGNGNLTNINSLWVADCALTRILYGDNQGRIQANTAGFSSAAASASVSDETGTGLWVFNASPAFSGTATFTNVHSGNFTTTGNITNRGGLAMTINIPVMTNTISAGTMYFTNGILMKFE